VVHKGCVVPFFSILPLMTDRLLELIINLLYLIPSCAVLLIWTAAAWYAAVLIRAHLSKTELHPADYLESFKKLHEEGKLTAEEFRIIRGLLSLQLTRSPCKPKPDYSLLNKHSPSQLPDRPSGNIQKN
jgi:hypothetical protein